MCKKSNLFRINFLPMTSPEFRSKTGFDSHILASSRVKKTRIFGRCGAAANAISKRVRVMEKGLVEL
jgi:hypothetical protein